jgi:hypothetical protein
MRKFQICYKTRNKVTLNDLTLVLFARRGFCGPKTMKNEKDSTQLKTRKPLSKVPYPIVLNQALGIMSFGLEIT